VLYSSIKYGLFPKILHITVLKDGMYVYSWVYCIVTVTLYPRLELSACVVISMMHAVPDFFKYHLDYVKLNHREILVGGFIFSHAALFVKWE